MSPNDVVKAWKDPKFRRGLAAEDLAALPDHPAGSHAIDPADLAAVNGASTEHLATLGCCGGFTTDPGWCSLGVCETHSCGRGGIGGDAFMGEPDISYFCCNTM